MTTARRVFELAMALMDSLDEATGQASVGDNLDYQHRTPGILNVLRGELYPYSDTFAQREDGKRPIVAVIESLDDEIDLDDYICQSVMPYGLAWHLLLGEDQTAASVFLQRYQELFSTLARGMPRSSEDVTDVYSSCGLEYGEFSRW